MSDDTPSLDQPIDAGVAGASARREFERRKAKRDTRIRESHPKLGGLILALSDEPQSTKAWDGGALGEERLGARLSALVGPGIHVLHDRRIPKSRANIDHIVVCSAGVYVIDAKRYVGKRPTRRTEGGLFSPRVEKLFVGSRDQTKLVAGVEGQVALVTAALDAGGFGDVPVRGVLCFLDGEWGLLPTPFAVGGVDVTWPRRLEKTLASPGGLDATRATRVAQCLAATFVPS